MQVYNLIQIISSINQNLCEIMQLICIYWYSHSMELREDGFRIFLQPQISEDDRVPYIKWSSIYITYKFFLHFNHL